MSIGFFDPEYRLHSEAITGYKGNLFSDKKDLMVIKGSDNPALAVRVWLDKRAHWLNWLTETQRKWQNRNSRRRGRHHDSRFIREKYVRCVGDMYEMPQYYRGEIPIV